MFYDSAGNKIREIPRQDSSPIITADDTGLYVAGGDYSLPGQCPAGGGDAEVRRYSLDGSQLWAHLFGTWDTDVATALALDESDIYASGNSGNNTFVARLDKNTTTATDSRPRIQNQCVVNAATFEGGALAPGELVTIFGSGLGPTNSAATQAHPGDLLPLALGGTKVLFNGIAAPLLSVSDHQINTVVPARAAVPGSNVEVKVEYQGVQSMPISLPVFDTRLGAFRDSSPQRQTIILNEDGTLNSPSNPATAGTVISLYATGAGPEDPPVADGQVIAAAPPQLRTTPHLYFSLYGASCDPISEFETDALFAGGVTASVNGFIQIQVRLPDAIIAGDWNLLMKINGPFIEGDPYRGPSTVTGANVSVR